MDVLSGLSICTNKHFRDMLNHLKQTAKLDNLHILGTVPINVSSMEQIEAILDKAVDMYNKLCAAQIWNSTQAMEDLVLWLLLQLTGSAGTAMALTIIDLSRFYKLYLYRWSEAREMIFYELN